MAGINWLWTDHRWAIWALIAAIELLLAVPTIRSVKAWRRYEQARTQGSFVTAQSTRVLGYFALSVASTGILAIFVFFFYNFVPLHDLIPSLAKPRPVWWILGTGTALLSLYVFSLSDAVAQRVSAEQQLQEAQEREKREQARRAEQRREEDQRQQAARERSRHEQEKRRREQARRTKEGSRDSQQKGGNRKNSSNRGRDRGDLGRPKGVSAHETLQVRPEASQEEIVAAYRKLVQMYHPDKVSGLAPEYAEIAERKMKDINAAYEQLKPRSER